ncbi:MAG: glycoside hydrolase, partial [Thermoplasmata archaeon]|nr:glycoside hydrolase [Thermoplasmata archaeon]
MTTPAPAGTVVRRTALATGVVLLLLLSWGSALGSSPTFAHATAPAPQATVRGTAPSSSLAAHGHTATPPASSHPLAPLAPPPVRRGVFFQSSMVPNAAVGNQTCYYGTCENVTNEPSVTYTSTGLLAAAYTSYTNVAPCAGGTFSAKTEVGFVASTNNGTNWTAPTYLGNPVCTGMDANYSSAYQPSLASLANGTLVLAYIEFNLTPYFFALPYIYAGPYSWSATYDRLVVSESYNNGTTWTTPTVLNSSVNLLGNRHAFAPIRPWVTTTGATIYVTWTNATEYYSVNYTSGGPMGLGSTAVHLIVSKDGGASWGAATTLKTYAGNGAVMAQNSMAIVGAGGNLVIAYTSNVSQRQNWCVAGTCFYTTTADVIVASSSNNGSTFSYAIAALDVMTQAYPRWSVYYDPSPQIAYSASSGQLAVVYSALSVGQVCYTYGCYITNYLPQVYVTNSSDGGTTWSTPRVAMPSLDALGTATFQVYNPAVAYDGAGVLHLAVSYYNGSACYRTIYGYLNCGTISEEYATSGTNGRGFIAPVLISDNVTFYPNNPDGEYATMVTAGGAVYVAWTMDVCPTWTYSTCYWVGSTGVAEVVVSSLFQGTGISLTFNETGIKNGTAWSAEAMGNVVSGLAPALLTLTGIPAGENLTWNVSNISGGYGIRYIGALSLLGPWTLTANTTVYDNFSEQLLVNIIAEPTLSTWTYSYLYCGAYQGYFWDFPVCSKTNYNITPAPGATWVKPGASLTTAVTQVPIYCKSGYYCYDTTYLNLTFDSWAGSGTGSVSTNSNT